MRLGGFARYLASASSQHDILKLVEWAENKKIPFLMVGGGSNIIWRDEGYKGLVIVNEIKGIELLAEDDKHATIRVGAGEVWDEVVAWTVARDLSGLEFLSLIPGSAGAGPVQNIGAYGTEIANTLQEVAVYDKQTGSFGSISAADCSFAARPGKARRPLATSPAAG